MYKILVTHDYDRLRRAFFTGFQDLIFIWFMMLVKNCSSVEKKLRKFDELILNEHR